jgi:hypothetical protein
MERTMTKQILTRTDMINPTAPRERYVSAVALAYAVTIIESLPRRWQEWSDKEDMKVILHKCYPEWEWLALQSARRHLYDAGHNVPASELKV